MAKCPRCNKEVENPIEVLKNDSFTVGAYECHSCHHAFKVINPLNSSAS